MAALPTIKLGDTGNYVRFIQRDLNGLALNYNGFSIDGVYGVKTMDVVNNFQDRFHIKSDGIVGSQTWKLLLDNVIAIQTLLNTYGYPVGHPDGLFSLAISTAVKHFQYVHGLYPSGIVDPRTRQRLFNPHQRDHYETRPSSRDLNSLNPYVASMARRFLHLTQADGMDVRIISAFRSWDEEDQLFAQGRWITGTIVTNARGGDSYHNWGLAFDAAPYENGIVSKDIEKFIRMGHFGQQVGLKWGGTFKDLVDYPHFQYSFGLNTWDLLNGVRPPH